MPAAPRASRSIDAGSGVAGPVGPVGPVGPLSPVLMLAPDVSRAKLLNVTLKSGCTTTLAQPYSGVEPCSTSRPRYPETSPPVELKCPKCPLKLLAEERCNDCSARVPNKELNIRAGPIEA